MSARPAAGGEQSKVSESLENRDYVPLLLLLSLPSPFDALFSSVAKNENPSTNAFWNDEHEGVMSRFDDDDGTAGARPVVMTLTLAAASAGCLTSAQSWIH